MPIAIDARPGVIYALIDPRTNKPRYVGKTATPRQRWRHHHSELSAGRHNNRHLQHWFNQLRRGGVAPKYVVLQECLPFTIDECEREWIARGKRKGWKLCNIAEGGGSGQFSDATKAVLRGISRGRWSDPDYQRRHEASRARRAGLSVGEYRERIEERLRQRKGNLDRWRQNMAIAAERAEKKRERFVFVRITHGDVAFVPLSRGAWAAIDAEDWCRIAQWKWHLQIKGRYKRAKRTVNKHGEIELLNRRVTNAGDHQYVMHRNGNQLDCRKQNLHVRTYANGRGVSRDETEPYDT